MRTNDITLLTVACALAAVTVGPVQAVPMTTTTVIVSTAAAAPDGNGTLDYFGSPALNDAGQVAFTARIIGTRDGYSEDRGIFSGAFTGELVQIALEGQAATGGNGTFWSFFGVALNDAGQVAFTADLIGTSGGSSDDRGIYLGDGTAGPLQIARYGQAAPDGNGTIDFFYDDLVLNNAGQVAFRAGLNATSDGSNDSVGIYRGDGSVDPVQIARAGQSPLGSSGTFEWLRQPALNDAGQVGFAADFRFSFSGDSGSFRIDGIDGVQIARTGQAVPDGNGTFSFITSPAINEAGQAAFYAAVTGTSGGFTDNSGIFRSNASGVLVQIARQGQAAPDGNGFFDGFDDLAISALNRVGQVAFEAELRDTTGGFNDDTGIYRGTGIGELVLIVREGQTAPDGNGSFDFLRSHALNDAGQVAFEARIRDTSSGSDDNGIFFYDDLLGLLTVAREGDAFLGSTIDYLSFNPSGAQVNELGQVAYRYALADGNSGIAVWVADLELIPGDTDGDGDVDDTDLGTSFVNYTGPVGDVGKTASEGDTDGDGDVDDTDLGTSFSAYTGPLTANVPEPTSLILLGLSGILVAGRRHS